MCRRKIWVAAFLLLGITTLPYLLALDGSGQAVFGGFLLNPTDGNTYLAKMQQGWNGSWRFVLPYTAEAGQGAYLFLFYLALGHFARLLGLPLILVFHLARCLGVVLMVFALANLFDRLFVDQPRRSLPALYLALFASGMGWIVVLAGALPSDMWVAEAYPFLSAYANPHFPLGLALLLAIFVRLLSPVNGRGRTTLFVFGLLLAIILPFGVVVLAVASGVWTLWGWVDARKIAPRDLLNLACLFTGGGAFLLYQYITVLRDPVLAQWNAQNITPTPPLWDVLVSFSPALLLALVALPVLWKRRADPAARLLLSWFVAGLVLVYLPFSLQRRFLLGFYIPTAALGVYGISRLAGSPSRFRRIYSAIFVLSIITNAAVLLAGWVGIQSRDPLLYLSANEDRALGWINSQTSRQDVVLASPVMGLFIPAHTGRRVIYGHPFETANAQQEQAAVQDFFTSSDPDAGRAFLVRRGVSYVFYGPREQKIGHPAVLQQLRVAYQSGDVTIYQASDNP